MLENKSFKGRNDCLYYRQAEAKFTFIDNIIKQHEREKKSPWDIRK